MKLNLCADQFLPFLDDLLSFLSLPLCLMYSFYGDTKLSKQQQL